MLVFLFIFTCKMALLALLFLSGIRGRLKIVMLSVVMPTVEKSREYLT